MIYYKLENWEIVETQDLTTQERESKEGQWVLDTSPIMDRIEQEGRKWRDKKLSDTDYIVYVTDHPQHSDYMAYRVTLRNWPSTSDFPATRPTL